MYIRPQIEVALLVRSTAHQGSEYFVAENSDSVLSDSTQLSSGFKNANVCIRLESVGGRVPKTTCGMRGGSICM